MDYRNNQVGMADSAAKIEAMTTIQSTTAKNFTFRLVEEAMPKLEQEKSPGCNFSDHSGPVVPNIQESRQLAEKASSFDYPYMRIMYIMLNDIWI